MIATAVEILRRGTTAFEGVAHAGSGMPGALKGVASHDIAFRTVIELRQFAKIGSV